MRLRVPALILVAVLLLFPNQKIRGESTLSPYLVKDINTSTSEGTFIMALFPFENGAYFYGYHGEGDLSFWKTDGTEQGTVFLKNLSINILNNPPSEKPYGANLNGTFFFKGCRTLPASFNTECELWKTDGTSEGTVLAADLTPGDASSDPHNFTPMGGKLYFLTRKGLWRIDSVDSAPNLVMEISTSVNYPFSVSDLWASNNRLYFAANDTTHGTELWVSDGTTAGTRILNDLRPGIESSGANPVLLYDHLLYFAADDGTSGIELWVYDEAQDSIRLVSDVNAYYYSGLYQAARMGDTVFFSACAAYNSCQLYRTEGDQSRLLFNLHPSLAPGMPLPLGEIQTPNGARFLFLGQDANGVYDLWGTDGSEEGSYIIRKNELSAEGNYLTAYNSKPDVVFSGGYYFLNINDPTSGTELWRTDGTSMGTLLIKDIYPGVRSSQSRLLGANSSQVFFSANDGDHGDELWVTTGSLENTHLVIDLNPNVPSSNPNSLIGIDRWVYFLADDSTTIGLWRSDGSTEGTQKVWTNPSNPDNGPANLAKVGNWLFFTTNDLYHGNELWVMEGPSGSIHLVKDIAPGMTGSYPRKLTPSRNGLFFVADDILQRPQLWISDGTDSGTQMITNKNIYPIDSENSSMGQVDGKILFVVYDPNGHPISLWRTDGTQTGTKSIIDLPSTPRYIIQNNGVWYFNLYDRMTGKDIPWQSNGTESGTYPLLFPHCLDSYVNLSKPYHAGNNVFWFTDNFIDNKLTMIKTGGTSLTCVFSFPTVNRYPKVGDGMYDFNGRGIFATYDSQYVYHSWVTDGSTTGTFIMPGDPSLGRLRSGNAGPLLYMDVGTTETGYELSVWNGSNTSPQLLADINPGMSSSDPGNFLVWNHKLYFTASDGIERGSGHGKELWAYDVPVVDFFFPIIGR